MDRFVVVCCMPNGKTVESDGAGSAVLEHGAYRELKSYQTAEIVYDATVDFCSRYIPRKSSAYDQMIEAARYGKQGIMEGNEVAAASKKMELKLTGLARANLEKLLQDCEEFLRERELPVWDKNSPDALKVRVLAYEPDRSYECYRSHVRRSPESGANTLMCLVNQATYLLRRQMESLEYQMLQHAGGPYRVHRRRGA